MNAQSYNPELVVKWLDEKYDSTGGFRVMCWRFIDDNIREAMRLSWTDWKGIAPAPQRRVLLRELFKTEILFDIDYPRDEAARNAKRILDWLRDQHIEAIAYYTGRKGQHVSAEFNEMREWTEDQRKRARRWWFKKAEDELGVKVDNAKQTGMVACEGVPHFKHVHGTTIAQSLSGLPIKAVTGAYRFIEPNALPKDCVTNALVEPPKFKTVEHSKLAPEQVWNHPFIAHIRSRTWPKNGKRHMVLLKNIAALCVDASMSDDQIREVARSIEPNIPDADTRIEHGVLGWARWLRYKETA